MTHAFMYGTATFEGIRAYWNADQGVLYGLKLREHVERIRQSCKILLMEDIPSVDELTGLIVETIRRNGFREDAYIRPVVLQVQPGHRRPAPRARERAVHHRPAVRELHRHRRRLPGHDVVLAAERRRGDPGPRQDRRRLREHGLPEVRGGAQRLRRGPRADGQRPRQRGVGGQPVRRPRRRRAHAAGQRRPARGRDPQGDDGADAQRGRSPSRSRSIDRSELYIADEAFLCGTGVQISPIIEVDHRPVGSGKIGPIGRLLRDRYFDAVRGKLPEYEHWLTPIA